MALSEGLSETEKGVVLTSCQPPGALAGSGTPRGPRMLSGGVWKGGAGTQWKELSAGEEDLAEAGFGLGVAIATQAYHSDLGVVSCLALCGSHRASGLC